MVKKLMALNLSLLVCSGNGMDAKHLAAPKKNSSYFKQTAPTAQQLKPYHEVLDEQYIEKEEGIACCHVVICCPVIAVIVVANAIKNGLALCSKK